MELDPIAKLTGPNIEKRNKNLENGLPARSHFPWSDAELRRVVHLFESDKKTLSELAQLFERSPLGIAAQLVKNGEFPVNAFELLINDLDIDKKRKKSIEIENHFLKYKIHNLYHITHRENIKSIVEHGILNFYDAQKLNTSHIDISNPDVQKKRERTEEHYKRRIHEYSSLYFNPKNAMLRYLWDKKNDLCFLQVSLLALAEVEYLISDGNAASQVTKFYYSLDQLNLLSWDIILAENWASHDDGKRKRCAEVLIYPKIHPDYIKNIYCFSIDTENYLANCGKIIKLHKDLF